MGPTACGKTNAAITLKQKNPLIEIISVDSGMIYRDMDIGTAKPTKEELSIAPHRLINIIDPVESYSVGKFFIDVNREITEILAAGKIPLLVGGTMMYFRAIQHGLAKLPEADAEIRQEIRKEAFRKGWENMHSYLTTFDPQAAAKIKPTDAKRIERAIEIYRLTGNCVTNLINNDKNSKLPYRFLNLVLTVKDKNILWQRIAKRVDFMLQNGFIDEVANLFNRGDLDESLPSMSAVGYRQVWNYLAGALPKNELRERIVIATRQLAKRQMTWLRNWPEAIWFSDSNKLLITNDELLITNFGRLREEKY
jgi:tRNA dimethylallyltransferase